jgi:SSS family solute:Na+ symporter
MWYLAALVLFAIAQIALGLIIARRVKGARDFFVAGRALGPGLLFSTFLAANIGAGSTVGAAGFGYTFGLSAWWWVGSAGLGSIVLALWIGPRMRQLSAAHDLRTVGDFLEWRFDRRVRAVISVILWFGALALLAGQLLAMSKLMKTVTGWDGWIGCVIGGAVMTTYSAAGGMKSTAWVNIIQLTVKMLGFFVALPIVLGTVHGLDGLHAATATASPEYWNFWQNGSMGWIYLFTLLPSFYVSPGLIQKTYAARDDRTVRIGVGVNAIALLIYAAMPVLLGMSARVLHPGLKDQDLALPMLLVHNLPPLVGMLAMAALFSAEISAADVALFMLTTSLSQDMYRRFLNPSATDARVLQVARWTTFAAGSLSVALAIVLPSVGGALTIFYTIMAVSLFVPITGGIAWPRLRARDALAGIAVGMLVVIATRFGNNGQAVPIMSPAFWGLLAATLATGITMLVGVDGSVKEHVRG